MILAAGEGRRMQPLTLTQPKPLLAVGDYSLLEHHIIRLRAAGIEQVIINVAYLGEQIVKALGDGHQFGVNIEYSQEPEPLETGGALYHALDLLGEMPFLLVNGDIWTDFPFAQLMLESTQVVGAHLVLVDNPQHNPAGDFCLLANGQLQWAGTLGEATYTFAGISLFHPRLIHEYPQLRRRFALREVFDWAMSNQSLSGQHYAGVWSDVGTPARLEQVREQWRQTEGLK